MADPVQDNLLREIDEELRQENLAKLWKNYGGYVIAAAVALVLVVAGYQWWRHYDDSRRMEEGGRFFTALELARQNRMDDAQASFAELAADARPGYAQLSQLQRAALLAHQGDRAAAAQVYEAMANDAKTDPLYRDLAILLGVMQRIDGGGEAAELQARLEPLTKDANPWRHSARELLAAIALGRGETEKARQLLFSITQDASTPVGMAERAGELLAGLGAKEQ